MRVEEEDEGVVIISMPVTDKVKQPFGYLHGGASLALGETACSLGAANLIDTTQYIPLGLEMNANHIHSTKEDVSQQLLRSYIKVVQHKYGMLKSKMTRIN